MSFKCVVCTNVTKKPVKFISKKREKIYPNTYKKGWEIVEEKNLCKDCADNMQGSTVPMVQLPAPVATKKFLISLPAKPKKAKEPSEKKPRKPRTAKEAQTNDAT